MFDLVGVAHGSGERLQDHFDHVTVFVLQEMTERFCMGAPVAKSASFHGPAADRSRTLSTLAGRSEYPLDGFYSIRCATPVPAEGERAYSTRLITTAVMSSC